MGDEPLELLGVAVEAARMAGGRLVRRARAGAESSVTSKSTPTDLVSEADVDSERAIRELLRERRPRDGFIGEESDVAAEPGVSGLRWVVDPLDGTVNFVFGIPQWCVSVAVRDANGTVAGAIYDPNREELFCAHRDGPATLVTRDGETELHGRVRAVTPSAAPSAEHALAAAMVATGLYYDADVREAQGKVLARLVGRVRDVRRFGSAALDLGWTAAGRYDAYFERGVKQWDIAAGALICECAGLRVLELAEHPKLPSGILVAPDEIAAQLEELVAGP
jgi:myo-inositol-1(or 4)-monophosphatase